MVCCPSAHPWGGRHRLRVLAGRVVQQLPGISVRSRTAPSGPRLDDHISWPTATRSARDLACDAAGGYSVGAAMDGKEKVYGSIP
jgi:hypothetical protein